jgi:radical SAM protein with 4Fe4S-binding SPASM domain
MSPELYEKVMGDLRDVEFDGGILYSAFSEPLLQKNIGSLIQITRNYLPDSRVEAVCNGDFVTPERLNQLFSDGLTVLSISMYDGPHQQEIFEQMREQVGLTNDQLLLRVRWLPPEEHFGITLSNRGGTMVMPEVNIAPLKEPLKQRCYYPFYQILVDHDGTVLLCPHDWGKKLKVGNLGDQSIQEIWDSPAIKRVRLSLAKGDRNFPPCASCDVDGTLMGQSHFDKWMEHYNNS